MREPKPSSDTDAWFDALAGRRGDQTPSNGTAAAAEGLLLREALRRWPAVQPAPDAVADRARLAALLAAAHADERLAARKRGCRACQAMVRWLSWPRLAGATALVAAVSMTAVFAPWPVTDPTFPRPGAGEATRGPALEGVQRLHTADPRALRDRLVAEFAQIGIAATRYEHLGRYGLDVELPAVRSDPLDRLLARHGIVAPAGGGLVVEVDSGP